MSKTVFVKDGKSLLPIDESYLASIAEIPVGNYVVKFNALKNTFYLDAVDEFNLPSKFYGDTIANADRILSTFSDRSGTTGVLLSGEKGSGKSLLAKTVSHKAAQELNMPTLIINTSFHGDIFNSFMQSIHQPVVVLFDEFEKVYDDDSQEGLLTLLDGVFPSKKLFILTCNLVHGINTHMMNRPGRLFYAFEFNSLSQTFIEEYANDKLKNKAFVKELLAVAVSFGGFTFDMIQAVVEEMNRYNETPREVLNVLNVSPKTEMSAYFDVTAFRGDVQLNVSPNKYRHNPLSDHQMGFHIYEQNDNSGIGEEDLDLDDDDNTWITLSSSDVEKFDIFTGEIIFIKDGITFKFNKPVVAPFDYSRFAAF